MSEEIRTGGLKKFVVGKTSKIEPELARKIDDAYEKAEIRKARVRKRRNLIIKIIIAIIILIIAGYFLFR